MENLGKAELLEEGSHLLLLLSDLRELSLHNLLQHRFKLRLESAYSRGRHGAQLCIDLRLLVNLIVHWNQVDKVLWVSLGQFCGRDGLFVVDLFVVIDCLGKHLLSGLEFSFEILLIGTAASLSKRPCIGEFLDTESQIGHSKVHPFALVTSLGKLVRAKLPVRHCAEVLRVISKHVRELAVVKVAEVWINLVSLKSFFEVDSDLSSDFG